MSKYNLDYLFTFDHGKEMRLRSPEMSLKASSNNLNDKNKKFAYWKIKATFDKLKILVVNDTKVSTTCLSQCISLSKPPINKMRII